LADLGHRVIGVDLDDYKVRTVMAGEAPFFEPNLRDIIAANVASRRLTATTEIEEALPSTDICFICVGTPSSANNDVALEHLQRVCRRIAEMLVERSKSLTVVIRSTIFPGTCEGVIYKILRPDSCASLVVNPEFLREGSAVGDFMEPSLVVIGSDDNTALESVARLYAPLKAEICRVSLRTAEMIKYACNSFHALKIGFANEIGALCERLGVPPAEVMATLCKDRKLNISPAYLRPGFAFGGSCLPKDLRAMNYRASHLKMSLPLIGAVLPSNEEHLRRAMEAVERLPAQRIGIFGLAFKENTDDLRESPVVPLLNRLLQSGKQVSVYDPHIQVERIYGSNRHFAVASIPQLETLLERSLEKLLGWAGHIVLTQTAAPEDAAQMARSGLPVLDLAGGSAHIPPFH